MRVFLDTNVLVSAFTTRGLSADVFRLVLAEHQLLTGEVNVKELRRVLRTKMRAPVPAVDAAVRLLREQEIIKRPKAKLALKVRDPDDAWVLASAVIGGAGILVTGDQDLLVWNGIAPIPIVTPRAFWERARPPQ